MRQPRAQRFSELVLPAAADLAAAQDRFHVDRHGADSAAWVLMSREDARSVSRTEVQTTAGGLALGYTELPEDSNVVPPVKLVDVHVQ